MILLNLTVMDILTSAGLICSHLRSNHVDHISKILGGVYTSYDQTK